MYIYNVTSYVKTVYVFIYYFSVSWALDALSTGDAVVSFLLNSQLEAQPRQCCKHPLVDFLSQPHCAVPGVEVTSAPSRPGLFHG